MNSAEVNFTSTGIKFLKYLDRLKEFQEGKPVRPITLHVMPESRCNLKCGFCSVAKRDMHESLSIDIIKGTVSSLCNIGLKGIVISGGGEPTLYKSINELLRFLYESGLAVGLITNGTGFDKVDSLLINKLTWVRVSANVLDYVDEDKLKIPIFNNSTVFGMSYIVSLDTKEDSLVKVKKFADKYNAKYVRVAADCLVSDVLLEEQNRRISNAVNDLNDGRFFHHYKKHGTPPRCYLGYFHPILYCDGYIYPCDSLVLNDKNQEFNKEWRLCKAEDIIDTLYIRGAYRSLVNSQERCKACVWKNQNDFLCSVVDYVEHTEFV